MDLRIVDRRYRSEERIVESGFDLRIVDFLFLKISKRIDDFKIFMDNLENLFFF